MSDPSKQSRDQQGPSKPLSQKPFEERDLADDHLHEVHSQLMREKDEPSEGFSPMPLVLVFVIMLLAFWGGIYMVSYGGMFSPFHFDETASPQVVAAEGPREVDMLVLGQRVYARNCQLCHQASGAGQAGVYPPVANADWVQDNPERLIKVVLHGLEGRVVVNGNTYNNAMIGFSQLSDENIAAVLTYLRTDEAFANDSYPVSPELVAEVRADFAARRTAWTQPELDDIHGPVTGDWTPEEGDEPAETEDGEPIGETDEADETDEDDLEEA